MIGLWLSHCPKLPKSPVSANHLSPWVIYSLLGSAQRTRSKLEGCRGRRDLFPFFLFPNIIFSSMTHTLTCCWSQSPDFPIIWALWDPKILQCQEEYDLTRSNSSFHIQPWGCWLILQFPRLCPPFAFLGPPNLINFLRLVTTVTMGDIISVFSTGHWLIQHSCK